MGAHGWRSFRLFYGHTFKDTRGRFARRLEGLDRRHDIRAATEKEVVPCPPAR
jgi:hypothetical protein